MIQHRERIHWFQFIYVHVLQLGNDRMTHRTEKGKLRGADGELVSCYGRKVLALRYVPV